MMVRWRWPSLLLLLSLLPCSLIAQVTYDRLLHPSKEPQNWLTYSGSYSSERYSLLNQITLANVKNLELKWVFQEQSEAKFEATPLVVDGVMYVPQARSDVVALDAKTGRVFWIYHYAPSPKTKICCGGVSRGLAILGDTLFLGTVDAHLVAIDAKNGRPLWDTKVAETADGYSTPIAPLVIAKDKVVVGVGGSDIGIRGFIAAYDAKTGKEQWRFYTVPAPGEPGHETWGGDSWMKGGGSAWLTGSYDPELNLLYQGTGNPWPTYNSAARPGDNLYTESVVALDADTGKLKWYFQSNPNDAHDWDALQIPVLVDTNWKGTPRKLMYWARRNSFFYVLDRVTGEFLSAVPFTKQTWAASIDPKTGRPTENPQPLGTLVYPGPEGGTNWWSPSYSPRTGLFYIPTWEDFAGVYRPAGGVTFPESGGIRINVGRTGPINTYTDLNGHGGVVALDPRTGEKKWSFYIYDYNTSGIVTTATDLLFVGGREGHFQALNANSGALLWKTNLGGEIVAAPITYQVDGKQYVAVGSGTALFAFALRD